MLKANELRLGNWVNYPNDDTKYKVLEIFETGISVIDSDYGCFYIIPG